MRNARTMLALFFTRLAFLVLPDGMPGIAKNLILAEDDLDQHRQLQKVERKPRVR